MKDFANEIDAAVKALGDIAYEDALENCPVRTGRLKRSLKLIKEHNRATNETTVLIGTTVPYAKYVEFGTGGRRPRHFLANAAEKARSRAAVLFDIFIGGA